MKSCSLGFRWLLVGLLLVTGQVISAAEPDEKPEPATKAKWEGEYPQLPIQKITREEFDAGWQIDLSVKDWPLGDVLEKIIQGEKGWQVEIAPNAVLNKKISLDLKKVSRLEAIELACREIDYHPDYSSSNRLNRYDALSKKLRDIPQEKWADFINEFNGTTNATILSVRPGKYPAIEGQSPHNEPYPSVAFAGPVRLQITELTEDAPHTTGELKLKVQWLPLPKNVGPNAPDEVEEMHWQMGAIISTEGDNLLASSNGSTFGGLSQTNLFGLEKSYSLKSLLKDIDRIALLSWQVHFYLPTEWKPMWFEYPKSGDKVTKGDFTVTYGGRWYPEPASGFMLDHSSYGSRGSMKQMRIFAFDSEGDPVDPGVSLVDGTRTSGRSLHLSETPALFVVVPITKSVDVAYSYAFKDIPLSKHKQQPEKLTELDYGDHEAPVSVKDLQPVEKEEEEPIGKRGDVNLMQAKLTNHSNKPIQQVRVAVFQVDDQGKPRHRRGGGRSFLYFRSDDGFAQVGTMIDPGETITKETYYHKLLDKEIKYGMEIDQVIFLDKTEWKPKQTSLEVPF